MRPAMVDAEIGQRQVRVDTGHPAPSCNSGCRMTAWRRVCASALFAGGDDFYFEARRVLQPSRVMVRAPGVGIAVVVQRLPPALRRRGHHGVHVRGRASFEGEVVDPGLTPVMRDIAYVGRTREREIGLSRVPRVPTDPPLSELETNLGQEPAPLTSHLLKISKPHFNVMKT